jgi:excisionase family DNA binding protein
MGLSEKMNMSDIEKLGSLLSTSQVARLLNVHVNTIRRWSRDGTLKTYRINTRGDRRFNREDVFNLLLEQSKLV